MSPSCFDVRSSRRRKRWLFLVLPLVLCKHGLVTSFVPNLCEGKASISQNFASGGLSKDSLSSTEATFLSQEKNENKTLTYNFWDGHSTIASFNMDLHNLAINDPIKAIDCLDIMEEKFIENPQDPNRLRPDSASFTTVIEGLCFGNHHKAAADRAQELLERMEKCEHLQPNQLTYSLVCQKWADLYKQDYTGENIQRAHDILMMLKETDKQPSKKLYMTVLEGWCRRAGKVNHAMNEAEALLKEMEESGGQIQPNVITYTSVIGGLARSGFPDLATRADGMLERMKEHSVEPDMVAYTSILNCWSKAVSRKEREQALERSLEIIRDMEDQYVKEEKYHIKPTAVTYATAIRAIGNSLHPNAPKIAEQLLWKMYNFTTTGTMNVPPSVGVWNAVITTFSTSGARSNKLENAKRAEQLLVEMLKRSMESEGAVEPNVRTWGAVLRAWAESGQPDSGEQAQRVLDQMHKWYEQQKISYRPNVVCYTTVMNAWGRGSAPSKVALENVEGLLKKMESVYEETQDSEVRPNKISYITALDVFSRKGKDRVGTLAQSTIDRMIMLYSKDIGFDRPTRIVFNALINAWSKSTEEDAAANAEKIFRWMENQYQAGDKFVKPDLVTLCGVLNAWANNAENGGAQRAQEIIDYTETLTFEERGFAHSIICYNILIKAWGRSRAPESVQRAERILRNLEENFLENRQSIRPDITTYSSVINCCAYYSGDTEGQGDALQIAMNTFNRMKEMGVAPNHITYGTLFKAIAKLTKVGREREKVIAGLFEKCCEEGQVDSFVLSQIRGATPMKRFNQLVLSKCHQMGNKNTNQDVVRNMPREWGRNVLE